MKRRRITIIQWLGLTAIIAVNLAWFRSFGNRRLFEGLDLIFIALQVSSCLLRSREGLRRFWSGFAALILAAGLALLLCGPLLLDAPLAPYYSDVIDYLEVTYLPAKLEGLLGASWEASRRTLFRARVQCRTVRRFDRRPNASCAYTGPQDEPGGRNGSD